MPVIAIDFETFYSKKTGCSLTRLLPEHYCRHALFDAYCISVCDGANWWAGHPHSFNWKTLENNIIVSHNKRFDYTVWDEMAKVGKFPAINCAEFHCTANLSSYICNRRSLADAVEFLYKVRLDKSERGGADGKRWPEDFSAERQKAMLEYARKDAYWCWRLWNDYSPLWPPMERQLSNLTIDQGRRGVKIDRALLNQYIIDAFDMKVSTEKVIPWIADAEEDEWVDWEDNRKPTSTKCIAEQCRRVNIPCPPVKSDDPEGYEEWEDKHSPAHPWIKAVGAWRSVNKLYKTFLLVKDRLSAEDIMPFDLLYFGAHCLTGDAEVLTRTGWTRLDEWKGGEIMQWDGQNLQMAEAIANKFKVSNGERLLQLKSGHVHTTVTEGHWFALFDPKTGKRHDKQAGEARVGRWKLPISASFIGGNVALEAWKIKLFVAVQADGHYLADCRSIRFRLSKLRKIERLRELLQHSSLDWKERINPSEPNVLEIIIRQYPEWLANRKNWTEEILTWTKETLETLCSELVHWDGHQCGPNSVEYTTTNKQNADWVSTIAHLVGKAASVSIKRLRPNGWNAAYRVFIRSATTTSISKANWSDAGAADEVFCPTAKWGACLFRHNGSIFISRQTGRWSGAGKLNLQNPRKKPIFRKVNGLMETDAVAEENANKALKKTGQLPAGYTAALDFRKLIIPRSGYKMITGDLSQVEPRCMAWLSGDTALLDKVREGYGVYEAFARANLGWTGGSLKDEDPDQYQMTKISVLGLGYGAGWAKFIKIASDYGVDLTANDPEFITVLDPVSGEEKQVSGYGKYSREVVAGFRQKAYRIPAFWKKLEEAFKRSIGGDFSMTLPSGRVMTYRDVRAQKEIRPDPVTGKPRKSVVFTAEVAGRRRKFYGGILAENIVQATARDVFALGMARVVSAGHQVLFSAHDELIAEVAPNVTPCDIRSLMTVTPQWMPGLPVEADVKEVLFYGK